jgi:hypothetical protein
MAYKKGNSSGMGDRLLIAEKLNWYLSSIFGVISDI